jgi:hypothetical protein
MNCTTAATAALFLQLRALVRSYDPIEIAEFTNHLGITQTEAIDLFIHGYPLDEEAQESFRSLGWSVEKQREVMRLQLQWSFDQGFTGLNPISLYNTRNERAA